MSLITVKHKTFWAGLHNQDYNHCTSSFGFFKQTRMVDENDNVIAEVTQQGNLPKQYSIEESLIPEEEIA